MPCFGDIGEIIEISRTGEEELSIEWRISNFRDVLSQSNDSDDWHASPKFRFDGGDWWLGLWPNWSKESRRPSSGWVRLGLLRWTQRPPQTFHFSVGIRGSAGAERSREAEQKFSGFCFWDDFCPKCELMEYRSRLKPDGILNITCVLERVVPGAARGYKKVVRDIAKLLDSGENSDVTVQVGDAEFKAHRAILSARSPVLAAMFRNDTEERASNRIIVEDCEPEVFEQYLHFIYTGSVERLSERNVFGLYRVADKYLADDLKERCLEHARDTLSVQTFCDVVKLALTHAQSGLLEQAIHFASENIRLIVRSEGWRNFFYDYPTEANEILVKSLGPPN